MYLSKWCFNKKFILLYALLLCSVSFSQVKDIEPDNSDIFITSGKSFINVKIKIIESWGLTFDNDEHVLYRVISKIKTNNKLVVNEVIKFVDSLKIDNSGNQFVIDFSKASVKVKPVVTVDETRKEFSLFVSALTGDNENCELGFLFFPKTYFPDYLFFQAKASFDLWYHLDDGYSVSGAFLGAGYNIKSEQSNILFGLNIGFKLIQYPDHIGKLVYDDGTKSVFVISPEVAFKQNFMAERFFAIVGARYYSDNVSIKGKINHFTVSFGIGVNL